MTTQESKQVVREFWRLMQTNDFEAPGQLFHDDYVLDWPQTGERIRGRANFAAINQNYPARGRWEFTIHRLIAEGSEAVSEVEVTDGAIRARVISFFTIEEGKILRQTEWWPDPSDRPAWRADWVESIPE